jgi:hypothetical protein
MKSSLLSRSLIVLALFFIAQTISLHHQITHVNGDDQELCQALHNTDHGDPNNYFAAAKFPQVDAELGQTYFFIKLFYTSSKGYSTRAPPHA